MTVTLYAITVLIWGTSWFAIPFQLGVVPPEVSVAYRFGFAALLLFAWCRFKKLPGGFSLKDHGFLALAGLSLFSINFLLFYYAARDLTTGLIAIVFSIAAVLNILMGAVFFGRRVERRTLFAAGLGLIGISAVFWPELSGFDLGQRTSISLVLCLVATTLFSLGNMISLRNQRVGLAVLPATAWGMAYGALALGLFALLAGKSFLFDFSPRYVVSLIYLALFATLIAFASYLTLLARIGPERAAYATILFPIIALLLSTLFEGYHWTPLALGGVALILLGNAIALIKPARVAVTIS